MSGARILIIEDNPANLELMAYLLQASGHITLRTRDGEEGLRAAQNEAPDIVLCDVQMPKLNGYEVVRRVRSMSRLERIPVIAVTAFAMVGDREKAFAAGFDGYLPKPIEPETFVRQVEDFLPEALRSIATARAPQPNAESADKPTRKGPTILVVDDVQANLELSASLLEPHGYRVVSTQYTARALELARDAPPDLVLSDVCMSEGSGYDFIRVFKSDPRLKSIPFVFITSTLTDVKEREKGLALGAAGFLFRPIEHQDLLATIEACLGEAGER